MKHARRTWRLNKNEIKGGTRAVNGQMHHDTGHTRCKHTPRKLKRLNKMMVLYYVLDRASGVYNEKLYRNKERTK